MYDTKHLVTLCDCIHHHPHRKHIKYLVKIDILALHFFPDAVNMFRPARDFRLDAFRPQLALQRFLEFLDEIDAVLWTAARHTFVLPEERRHRVVNRKARLNWALGGVTVALIALVMALSLALRGHQVAELEEAIAAVRGEAMQVDRIRNQIENASEAAGFLALRRAESPLAVEILADITRILPDDTYLDRLVIGRGSVQLQGKSGNAQQLIELVNESPFLAAAAFRGSTRLDARTGLEIFEINAEITAAGEDHGAGS